jgi:hypothetical protein
MRRPGLSLVVAAIGTALLAPSSVDAATSCGSLTKGKWRATDIRATHLSCASARTKLRRWLPPPLPANEFGWYCYKAAGRRQCVAGNGDAPRFSFRLKRRPRTFSAQVESHCRPVEGGDWRATSLSAFNMGCPSARAKLRRWLRRGRLPHNGLDGWDCTNLHAGRGQCIDYGTVSGDPIGFKYKLRRVRF